MTALLTAPILLTITLVTSGLAKLGGAAKRRTTEDAMLSLRLPMRALHPLGAAIVPPAEILLAILLWVPVPVVQTIAAALTLLLMAAYLLIVARALAFDEAVTCSCFGTLGSPTVSRATLSRNILLVVLGALALSAAARGDIAEAVREHSGPLMAWTLGILAATALAVLAMGGLRPGAEQSSSAAPAAAAAAPSPAMTAPGSRGGDEELSEEADELEYVRLPIPFGMLLEHVDGGDIHRTVQELLQERAQLLIWVRPGCGPCVRTIDQMAQWQERLGPLVELRALFFRPLGEVPQDALARAGTGSAYDIEENLARSFGVRSTPSAVLLGADGLTAGGPVVGGPAVEEFVEEIIEQLGIAAPTAAPADAEGAAAV